MTNTHELKERILNNICYTELVYNRINKKLGIDLTKKEIEVLILNIITASESKDLIIRGKNYYVSNIQEGVRVTINSNTYRVITVDKI